MGKNKVIFVGHPKIHEALEQMWPDWDFQSPIADTDELVKELNDPNGKVDNASSMIMLFSGVYDSNPDLFSTTVAYFAPHVAMLILTPEGDPNKNKMITEIRAKQAAFEADEENGYSANTPYYFVDYANPQEETQAALAEYIENPYVNDQAKSVVRELLPSFMLDDGFEEYDDTPNEELEEELDLKPDSESGQVITVTSSKGGSGKSTVSLVLASYLAQGSKVSYETGLEDKPLDVVILDLDTRDGQLGFLTGAIEPNVLQIFKDAPSGELTPEIVKKGVIRNDELGIDIIGATKRARHAKGVPPEFYARLITQLKKMYDIVILDTSVNYLDDLFETVAYPISNTILFVTDMGISSIYGMARWIMETSRSKENGGGGLDLNKVGIIVNKAMADVNMDASKIEAGAGGVPILAFLPSAPSLFTYAANTQSLHRTLEVKHINQAFYGLAQNVTRDMDYEIGEVPYLHE